MEGRIGEGEEVEARGGSQGEVGHGEGWVERRWIKGQ